MSVWHSQRTCMGLAAFAAAMVALAAWAWLRYGVSLVTALAVVIAIACVAAMLYAWRLGRSAFRPLDEAGRDEGGAHPATKPEDKHEPLAR